LAVALWRKKPFDRNEALAVADRHRARGRKKKAIAAYRDVLAVDPSDVAVHSKLAPLLAKNGQKGEALASFHVAAQGYVHKGFIDRAIAVYVQARSFFPREAMLWDELARLYQARERRADALRTLLEGGRKLGRRTASRAHAIRLLGQALVLEPWHAKATLGLALLLSKDGQGSEARALLAGLACRVRGKDLRRTRAALLRLSPTPSNAIGWVKALFGRR
jgi:tetratricopeptide (TPR) repeat protein